MDYFGIKSIILLTIISIMLIASYYVKKHLGLTNFEEILFYSLYLNVTGSHTDNKAFFLALKKCLPVAAIIFGILYLILYGISDKFANSFYPLLLIREHRTLFIVILFIIALVLLLNTIGLFSYLFYHSRKSNIIKNNYVDPESTEIKFDKKRNLVMIVVESLENSLLTKEQGGLWNYGVINELNDLLNDKDSVNFFDSNNHGMYMIEGTSYTSSSVFANNSGIPTKLGLLRRGYSKKKYLRGAYSLGEILKKNGYNNEVISAANTTYGGLKEFYEQHGDYNIIDIDNLDEHNIKINDSDKCDWGMNDRCLFNLAKKRLEALSKENKPFNLQLITIDTHFVDGYIGEYSETKHPRRYENAYATTSKLIKEFVDYIKKQPYYKDTTIVILGDHLIMQTDFVNDKMSNNRSVYNCIINPKLKPVYNKRTYTSLDTYPTIVSAMGGKIKGDKLGLGVNLFSKEKTLAEKLGVKKLNTELIKRSPFYDKKILKIK